jgi:hypothetical protein
MDSYGYRYHLNRKDNTYQPQQYCSLGRVSQAYKVPEHIFNRRAHIPNRRAHIPNRRAHIPNRRAHINRHGRLRRRHGILQMAGSGEAGMQMVFRLASSAVIAPLVICLVSNDFSVSVFTLRVGYFVYKHGFDYNI